jgi:hypothetical protein
MRPTEIRAHLLEQHAKIRKLALEVRALAEAATLERLRIAIVTHNRDEQRLLCEALPVADAWGEVRRVAMDDHHRREHTQLASALERYAIANDVAALRAFVDDLFAHMDVEERVLLHENVLRDDPIAIDLSAS